MSEASFKFEKANRSLMERLFEPPAVGKMSPVANVVAYMLLLVVWSVFVLFPIYWVVITSFKDAAAVNQGPFYIPFRGFSAEPQCLARPVQQRSLLRSVLRIGRQFGLLVYNTFAFIVSPLVTLQPMEPQICKIFLAFTNSIVVSIASTALCVTVGSMAAYALARIQYRPKFGNIMMFVVLTLAGHRRHQLCRRSLVGLYAPLPLPCSFSSRAPSASTSRARWAMATSFSGSSRSASCRPSW